MRRAAGVALAALLLIGCAAGLGSPRDATSAPALSAAERALLVDGDADAAERLLSGVGDDARAAFLLADLLDATGRPGRAAERYLRVIELARGERGLAELANAAAAALVAIRDRAADLPARLAALDGALAAPGALPADAVYALRNLIFALALRREDDAAVRAARLDATGCLSRWEVAGPYGPRTFAALDGAPEAFPQLAGNAPWPAESRLGPGRGLSASRVEAAVRCSVSAHDPAVPEPGLGLARTVVALDRGATVLFRLETDASARVYAGGVEIFAVERRTAWPARYAWFAAALPAGNTEIAVAIAHPDVRPTFSLAAVRADTGAALAAHDPGLLPSGAAAVPLPFPAPPPARTATDALARLRTAIWRDDIAAIAEAQADLARSGAVESWPALAAAADAALADPTQPLDTAFEAARRHAVRALAAEPRLWSARLLLARAEASDGRTGDAWALLQEGLRVAPDEPSIPERIADLALELGYAAEAAEAAAAMAALVPGSCAAASYRLAALRRTAGASRVGELAAAVAACDRSDDALANALTAAQRWEDARAERRRLEERDPGSPALVEATARVALAAGDLEAFADGVRRAVDLRPSSAERRRRLADALAAAGRLDAARAALDPIAPDSAAAPGQAIRDRAALDGAELFPALRVDGLAAIAAFRAARREYDTASVWVLDRAVHVIGRDGSRIEIVHNIAALLTAGAASEHGEVELPDDAVILTARAVKPDGALRTPERIAGKTSLSLPDLAPGDCVEVEYVRFAPPSPVFLGGFDTGRFFFRDFAHAFRRSEIVVVAPHSMPLEVDPRGDAPAGRERAFGDLRVLAFRARDVDPAIEEPFAPDAAELLPSIRVTSGAAVEAVCARVRELVADRGRSSAEIEALAARLVEGIPAADARGRLAALYAWTRDNIEDDGDLAGAVSHAVARRVGNRARVFLALARSAGLDGRLAFVRPAGADDTPNTAARLDIAERVAVYAGGQWASFETDAAPFGYLPPDLRHRPALFPDRCATATTDGGAIPRDTRRVEAVVRIDAGGGATAIAKEALTGTDAAGWRVDLRGASEEERTRLFAAEHVARIAPGSTLVRLSVSGLDRDDAPLGFEYELTLPALAVDAAGSLRGALPFSRALVRELGGRPARRAPAVLAAFAEESLSITVTPPDGAELRCAEADGRSDSPFGSAERRIARNGAVLAVRQELRLEASRIAADAYPAFLAFAAAADDLSRVEIEVAKPAEPQD